jgi:hypothetical protein
MCSHDCSMETKLVDLAKVSPKTSAITALSRNSPTVVANIGKGLGENVQEIAQMNFVTPASVALYRHENKQLKSTFAERFSEGRMGTAVRGYERALVSAELNCCAQGDC